MIPISDMQTFSASLLALYSPELRAGNFLAHAYRFLESVVPCDQINYGNLDPKSGSMEVSTNAPTDEWAEAVQGFGRCMTHHPFFNFDPAVHEGRPFFVSDFISTRQFRDLDIFSECFRLLRTSHHGALHLPTDDGRLLWFGLERSGTAGFSDQDRAVLLLTQQHLGNARRPALARTNSRDEIKLSPELFSRSNFTSKEAEVAYWLTEGKTNAEISLLLNVQISTIKGHITSLFNKIGVSNRLALTLHLLEMGRAAAILPIGMEKVPVRRS